MNNKDIEQMKPIDTSVMFVREVLLHCQRYDL